MPSWPGTSSRRSETATAGLVHRVVGERPPRLLSEIDQGRAKTKLTGFSAPMRLGSATWVTSEVHEVTSALRTQLTAACDLLAANGAGMLVTLDEIYHREVKVLRELARRRQLRP